MSSTGRSGTSHADPSRADLSKDRALARGDRRARSVIDANDGTVAKFIGDAVMAVFVGIPATHKDDALRAVRAAHGMSGPRSSARS